jgi:hypothetical protein
MYWNSYSERALSTAQRHPAGSATIYYNPTAPQISVLEPGFSSDVFVIPAVGLALAIAGLFVFRNGLSRKL